MTPRTSRAYFIRCLRSRNYIKPRQSWAWQTKISLVSLSPPLVRIDATCWTHLAVGTNLSLQDRLYQLRTETKEAFDEAKSLESRWKDVEREQREVYQVGHQMGQYYDSGACI